MVSVWSKEMRRRFPEPKSLQGNGLQFKTPIQEGTVYTTLYDVDIPKMNIQGTHGCIRLFVLNQLPDIYKKVSERYKLKLLENVTKLPLSARMKLSAETTYTCDVCSLIICQ